MGVSFFPQAAVKNPLLSPLRLGRRLAMLEDGRSPPVCAATHLGLLTAPSRRRSLSLVNRLHPASGPCTHSPAAASSNCALRQQLLVRRLVGENEKYDR